LIAAIWFYEVMTADPMWVGRFFALGFCVIQPRHHPNNGYTPTKKNQKKRRASLDTRRLSTQRLKP